MAQIPLTTWWGILIWVIVGAAVVAMFVCLWKYSDKLENWLVKIITKHFGANELNLTINKEKLNGDIQNLISDTIIDDEESCVRHCCYTCKNAKQVIWEYRQQEHHKQHKFISALKHFLILIICLWSNHPNQQLNTKNSAKEKCKHRTNHHTFQPFVLFQFLKEKNQCLK